MMNKDKLTIECESPEEVFKVLDVVHEAVSHLSQRNRELEDHIKEQEQETIENIELCRQMVHDIRQPLTTLIADSSILTERKKLSEESEKECLDMLHRSSQQIQDLSHLLELGCKPGSYYQDEFFDFYGVVENNARLYEGFMKDKQIGLRVYRKEEAKQIEVNFDKGVIVAIWATLFGNSLAWTPENRFIYQAFIKNGDSLEILMENQKLVNKRNDSIGMGKGRGLPFVQKIVSRMNGKFEKYTETKKNQLEHYGFFDCYGHKEADSKIEGEVFGVYLSLPLSNNGNSCIN